jgi:23S rRNA (guanosine2251-2'-O)-methyltransferase
MANHNRCWIWGRNAVVETLRAGRWPVIELLHSDRCEPKTRTETLSLATRSGIKSIAVLDEEITKRCRSDEHQGLAARMPPFPYLDLNELISQLPENPILVMLDRVHDPYNFGAIVRSADVLGIDGVVIGTREQAQVNSLSARSSAGAVNHVPIVQTDDLTLAVRSLSERGFQIIGTSDRATDLIFDPDFRQPTLLMIGNEGRGIQPALESLCTQFVQIPVMGTVNSLNAAVSAGILFYEVLRQRRPKTSLPDIN